MKIVAISGSPSRQSKTARLIDHAAARLAAQDIETQRFSVHDFAAEELLYGNFAADSVKAFQQAVARADGVLIATPVYKAAYAGALKVLLDLIPEGGLAGKPVLPLVSGGSPGHLLAVDYTLKPVLASLKASEIHQGVFAVEQQIVVTPAGQATLADELRQRLDEAVDDLVLLVKPANRLAAPHRGHDFISRTISL